MEITKPDRLRLERELLAEIEQLRKDAELTQAQMVAVVGHLQAKGGARNRSAWSDWQQSPQAVTALTYLGMLEVADRKLAETATLVAQRQEVVRRRRPRQSDLKRKAG